MAECSLKRHYFQLRASKKKFHGQVPKRPPIEKGERKTEYNERSETKNMKKS